MAAIAPSKAQPDVQHHFEGDASILNATTERRTELRKVLSALTQDLQSVQGASSQIKAEIKLQVGGDNPKEYVYTITVTDPGFDADNFSRRVERSTGAGFAGSPMVPGQSNGQEAMHRAEIDDDIVEIRPFKRQKVNSGRTSISDSQQTPASMAPMALSSTPSRPDESLAFLKSWHDEWTRQGGWLFDTLTKSSNIADGIGGTLEKKMESVQDMLGQSINASTAGTMAELGSITKLVHWLEHCRKTSADKVQAREEKWRSSSATFHDTTRREREAAEKRLEKRLDEQNRLLTKLVRHNGINLDESGQQSVGSDERSREPSLGAQLTAELKEQAGNQGGGEDEPSTIDD